MSDRNILEPHPDRAQLLAEAHARPFLPCEAGRVFLHFAFQANAEQNAFARRELIAFCAAQQREPPGQDARHFVTHLDAVTLRCEFHSEFLTYTWSGPSERGLIEFVRLLRQPGPHLVSVRVAFTQSNAPLEQGLDTAALAASDVYAGAAAIATDFMPDTDGFITIRVADVKLSAIERGSLCQRLLELETYRMLSLLGFAEAQRVVGTIDAIEKDLAVVTEQMTQVASHKEDRLLLDRLTSLAVQLEALATASLYRLSASRAYASIVEGRVKAIAEHPRVGFPTLHQFLDRRLAPAMRTCRMLEERQASLSTKHARAAQLLRTRVDVHLAQQNRDLLVAMNKRTQLQLLSQQMIEGLSVAGIVYYMLGVLAYIIGGLLPPSVEKTALAVLAPMAVLGVWLFVRRAHRSIGSLAGTNGNAGRSHGGDLAADL